MSSGKALKGGDVMIKSCTIQSTDLQRSIDNAIAEAEHKGNHVCKIEINGDITQSELHSLIKWYSENRHWHLRIHASDPDQTIIIAEKVKDLSAAIIPGSNPYT